MFFADRGRSGCRSTCLFCRLLCCVNTQQTNLRLAFWSLQDCRFSLYMQICLFTHTVLPAGRVIKSEYWCKRSYSETLRNPFCVFVVLLDMVLRDTAETWFLHEFWVDCSIYKGLFSDVFHGLTFLFGLLAGHLWQESVILQLPRTRLFSCVWNSPPPCNRSAEAGLLERANTRQPLPLCLAGNVA